MPLQHVEFTANEDSGHHTLVVLGAVHGNEKCGTLAIERFIADVESGKVVLTKGRVLVVPICNQRAYDADVRFLDRNLNRRLHPDNVGTGYEDQLNKPLCALLAQADTLLDLHSYISQGNEFIFLGGKIAEETRYAKALGVRDFVYGWEEAFGNANTQVDPFESMGTTEYTRHAGGFGVTLECGHHHNVDAPDVGYNAILHALAYFDMVDAKHKASARDDYRCVHMKQAFYKEKEGELAQPWKHYDALKKGDVLAVYTDGSEIIAPEDGHIVLPKLVANLGKEWFFFGVASDLPE